ncbi:MAG: bifunctional histidinol-phosphatase/imidazoleglycerol-phosphate dehydratase HisB [Bacteroidota bacterium]
MTKKYLFLDRDGTLIREPEDEQIDTLEKLELIPGVIRNLYKLQYQLDYRLVMVTNQDGLGTADYPEASFRLVQNKLLTMLENEGIHFEAVKIDTSTKSDPSPNRKPGTGMIEAYLSDGLDVDNSFVIGDRLTDAEMAEKAGLKSILTGKSTQNETQGNRLNVLSWDEIYEHLRARPSFIDRKTKETLITGKLVLNGTGKSEIHTGLGFFDHMLEQLPGHSKIDLWLNTKGDLNVDEHHTIEDTGLALGEAFVPALGNKKGLQRYGFSLPMDESQASCLIDLGGRAYLKWNVEFKREYIGDMPTEMFEHFFRSFAEASKSTIHISAEGKNEHHKIEAVFKAFARALKMAVQKDEQDEQLPTSKGKM